MKQFLSSFFRKIGLLQPIDYLRFHLIRLKNKSKNNQFTQEKPDVKLPNDYLIYESFQMDYSMYYHGGLSTAVWIADLIKKHVESSTGLTVLDWGCGPARVIRHLPELMTSKDDFYATDYNAKTIEWCKKNLKNIQFNHNQLTASLPYSNDFFDAIYGISIITHLSENKHYEWYQELYRILKPGGVLIISSHGENHKVKLSEIELQKYMAGQLVVRANVKEGHRTFTAFQPTAFMYNLFKNATIVEHIPGKTIGKDANQDIWIVKKLF